MTVGDILDLVKEGKEVPVSDLRYVILALDLTLANVITHSSLHLEDPKGVSSLVLAQIGQVLNHPLPRTPFTLH